MTPAAIQEAARLLNQARRDHRALVALPGDAAPRTMAEAYTIQDAVRATWSDTVAGWKIGATSPTIMAKFGVSEPILGPFFAADVYASPARPSAAHFQHLALESEFAYRLGRDLPARPAPYAREEILDAVDAMVPAFELVSPRFVEIPFANVAAAVADCSLNGAIVLGQPVTDWRQLEPTEIRVTLSIDAEVKGRGTGADVLGDPRNVLEWVVNMLAGRGVGLAKGQHLSTGTCTGVVLVQPGQVAVADFGPLGTVEMSFS